MWCLTYWDIALKRISPYSDHFDLDQSNLIFDPSGPNNYTVSSPVDVSVTSSGPSSGQTGGTATYSSTVTNGGSVTADGVFLVDTLPDKHKHAGS